MKEEKIIKELNKEINKDKKEYIGAIVLGLNDALIEITGTLAGLTLALQNSKIIAVVGLITGISASLSMSASEYLSIKSEKTKNKPIKSAFYTGFVYLLTVLLLISPYLLLDNVFNSLISTLIIALIIIFIFTYYISVKRNYPFKKRFFDMLWIGLGVVTISFIIGYIIRLIFGISV
ncbi:MAG: VIT1/CCC1 transporter family protein [Nanoarchaeota archaeon]